MQVVNIHGEKLGVNYEECKKRGCSNYRLWSHAKRNSRNCIEPTITEVICLMGKCIWETKDDEVE